MDQQRIEIESLIYRTEKLEEKYAEIRHLVSGTGEDYTHLLRTKTGKYSSKSVNHLINDLIGCLAEYRSYMEAVRNGHKAKMVKYTISDGDKKFYEAYFYLMLGLATYDNSGFYTRYHKPGTWDALLDRVSEPVEYQSQAELDADLILFDIEALEKLRIPSGLFTDICNAYNNITDDDFSSLLSDKERKAAYKLMTKEELHYAKNPGRKIADDTSDLENAKRNEDKDILAREFAELEKILKENPYAYAEDPLDDEDIADNHKTSVNNWNEYFTDRERFQDSCLTVKAGILDRIKKGYTFRKEIETSVKLYLAKNGFSKIADDDCFYTVYAYLNKARRFSEHDLFDTQK